MEVSDSSTWCSALQRKVNEYAPGHFKVRNLGIPGAPGLDRIATFRYQSFLNAKDVSVFLFGDNDAGWSQWFPRSGTVHENFPRPLARTLAKLEYEFGRGIEVAGWLRREVSLPILKRYARKTSRETIVAAEEAVSWAETRRADVLFVLQPNLLTLRSRDAWDARILSSTAKDLLVMLESAYASYRDWSSHSHSVVIATDLFDLESPSPYMGDWAHVNTRGNQLIADFVFDELKARGVLG